MEKQIELIKNWLGSGSINIFGMPFAGKDTQGNVLATMFGAELLGGGEILRNSIIPPETRKLLDAGDLFPTEEYMRIVLPYLSSERFAGKPLILSSVGRWHGEESGVMQAAAAAGHDIKAVLYLKTDELILRARHASVNASADRGERADDSADALENRLNEFRTKTLPVIDYYRDKNLLIEVDGNHSAPEVTEAVLGNLISLAGHSN